MHKKNFTLTEMLVVIAVFLILFSLLSTSLSKILRSANEAVCASLTHDLLVITFAYAENSDGYFMDMANQKNSTSTESKYPPYWTYGYWRELLTTEYNLSREHFYSPSNKNWNSDSFYYNGGTMIMGRMFFGSRGGYSMFNDATPAAKKGTPTFAIRNTDMPSQKVLWTDLNRRRGGYFVMPGDEIHPGSNHLYSPNVEWPSLSHNGLFDGSIEINDSASIQLQMRLIKLVDGVIVELFW